MVSRPIPRISVWVDMSEVHEFVFLIISQMILVLLVWSKAHTLRNSIVIVSSYVLFEPPWAAASRVLTPEQHNTHLSGGLRNLYFRHCYEQENVKNILL